MPGHGAFRTPILVPSFSSKGFPNIGHIIDVTEPYIESAVLVSAYDLHFGYIENALNFPSLLFVDSGGYEASKDIEMSNLFDVLATEYIPKDWCREFHDGVIAGREAIPATVFVSYGHPEVFVSLEDQIQNATRLGGAQRQMARELLIKPTTKTQKYLKVPEIVAHANDLSPFCAIGLTEKEIGKSLLERMVNIGKIREALSAVSLETPIHVFGSLDTMSTLLYFVMGADIFDGLTWLRYGYHEGSTLYRHEFAAVKLPATTNIDQINERLWQSNYLYLQDMELRMSRFLSLGDFSVFEWNCDKVIRLYQSATERLGG